MLNEAFRSTPKSGIQLITKASPGSDYPILASTFNLMGARMQFESGAEIYGEGEAAEFCYMVVKGTIRICKLLEDGRRQISAFHMAGDFFGIDEAASHGFAAEAIGETQVMVVRRSAFESLAARERGVAQELWMLMACKLRIAKSHMLLLGRKSAMEKVASFLLDMREQSPQAVIELPMSRQDIADFLGLTIETVSRVLTQLQQQKTISLASNRRISLRDLIGLQRMNG